MGRISPGPTRWPPGAERRLVPAKSNLKPQTSGKGRGRGDGGGPSSGGRGRGRGKGNHRVDQVSGADQVSDADRDYVENALNPADDPFQDEWIDESGCVHNVNAAAGGQNA